MRKTRLRRIDQRRRTTLLVPSSRSHGWPRASSGAQRVSGRTLSVAPVASALCTPNLHSFLRGSTANVPLQLSERQRDQRSGRCTTKRHGSPLDSMRKSNNHERAVIKLPVTCITLTTASTTLRPKRQRRLASRSASISAGNTGRLLPCWRARTSRNNVWNSSANPRSSEAVSSYGRSELEQVVDVVDVDAPIPYVRTPAERGNCGSRLHGAPADA
jgi:hypothetical protein